MSAPSALPLLIALGDTADSVASTLRAGSHRGTRSQHGCPVAAYLRAHGVSVVGVTLRTCTIPTGGRPARVSLPGPVRAFIHAFDAGRYPDLVETAAVRDPASSSLQQEATAMASIAAKGPPSPAGGGAGGLLPSHPEAI